MQQLIYLARKAVLRCWAVCLHPLHNWYARWLLYAGNAVYGPGLCSFGIPDVRISRGSRRRSVPCRIGREFTMRNGSHGVSRSSQRCLISVDRDGVLRIGNRIFCFYLERTLYKRPIVSHTSIWLHFSPARYEIQKAQDCWRLTDAGRRPRA